MSSIQLFNIYATLRLARQKGNFNVTSELPFMPISYYKRHNVTRANNYCTVKNGLWDNPLSVNGNGDMQRFYATFFVRAVSPEPLGRF